jgi:hypothetical protein
MKNGISTGNGGVWPVCIGRNLGSIRPVWVGGILLSAGSAKNMAIDVLNNVEIVA